MMNNVSLIITTYNEENSIRDWCMSIKSQSDLPEEVVVVDSTSSDRTVEIIKQELTDVLSLKVIIEKCNISRGRNIAITNASYENILITDAGVRLGSGWVKVLRKELSTHQVVAGYYKYTGTTATQCAYRDLYYVEANTIDPNDFMPSSRSLALKKHVWESVGGYNEKFDIGEDTDFDIKIKKEGFKIKFCPEALVSWDVRDKLSAVFLQQYKYSYWDGIISQNEAGHYKLFFIFIIQSVLFTYSIYYGLSYFSFIFFGFNYFRKFLSDRNRLNSILVKLILSITLPIIKAVSFMVGKTTSSVRRC